MDALGFDLAQISHSPLLWKQLLLAISSALLILLVLFTLAAFHRSENTELLAPVTLTLYASPGSIVFAPKHFPHSSSHVGKTPRVEVFFNLPGKGSQLVASVPLTVKINKRNSANVHCPAEESAVDGGQIGIDPQLRDAIEMWCAEVLRKEGRTINPDTDRFSVKLRYPSFLNLNFLMNEHPDASVRLSAWVFVVTSVFSVVQTILIGTLGL